MRALRPVAALLFVAALVLSLTVVAGTLRAPPKSAAAVAAPQPIEWPVRVSYTIGDGSDEPVKEHRFEGTGWSEWSERSFDPSFESCSALLPDLGLVTAVDDCASPYWSSPGHEAGTVISPNGYFRDLGGEALEPVTDLTAPAVAAVSERLGIPPSDLSVGTSEGLMSCPDVITECPLGATQQIPMIRTVVGHPGLDMVLSIEERVAGVLVYDLRVTRLEPIDAYTPPPAAVAAAQAGTTLDDVLNLD